MTGAGLAFAALAFAAPSAAFAQPFGGRLPEGPAAAGEVAPVSIEIRRDGRFFWSGRLDAGRTDGSAGVGLSATPPAFEQCFITVGGPAPGTRAQDRLGVSAAMSGPPEARHYAVTVEWAYLVSSLPPGAPDFYFCDHRYQSIHSLRFTAEAPVAPGARVRVDAPAGFELFLSRDPDPAAPPPAPPAPRPPEPAGIPAFDVTIDQAGARLWAGTIYRFGDELGEVEANYRVPRTLSCGAGAGRLSMVDRRDGEWSLRMSPDPNDDAFGIVFSSQRDESEAGRPPRSCLDGAVRRVEVRLETAVAIPPGRTTIVRADDDVAIRIRPR